MLTNHVTVNTGVDVKPAGQPPIGGGPLDL
jgi:hypothetical protein